MLVAILTALAFVSATLTIYAASQNHRRLLLYVFKPLTILFIILIAVQVKSPASSFYRYMIIGGLIFSLAGDVFLMLPSDRFIQGLVSFFVAHLFYIAALIFEGGQETHFRIIFAFMLYGMLMVQLLWPHLGKMRLPVLAYMLVILMMGWTATGRWIGTKQPGSLFAFLGAILFIISDSALAVDRFKGHFTKAQVYILTTYFAAQWLIALST
jgi:uncharacterized membrane protein YhhN